MSYKNKRVIAFLGNYLPRKCGIATFTTDICNAVSKELGTLANVFSIAMTDKPEGYSYPEMVKLDIQAQKVSDYEKVKHDCQGKVTDNEFEISRFKSVLDMTFIVFGHVKFHGTVS